MPPQTTPCQRATLLRLVLTLKAFLNELPRWLLLAVIVYAPWAYGCTRWWTKTLLIQLLLVVTVLWLCSLCLRRRWPRVTVLSGVVAFSLLGLGWFSVFNSLATYDELLQVFSRLPQAVPGWLGSWDAAFSMRTMLLVTALTGAFFVSMDLAANPVWRKRLFLTLALSGGLLLLFGLVERATGAAGIFWEPAASRSTFFATYFYHGNAGAYINLTLPLVAGQTILAFQRKRSQFERAFWSFLALASITAVFVNTSRASTLIGILIIAAMAIGGAAIAIRRPKRVLRLQVLATAGIVLGCAVILMLSFGIERSLIRWNQTLSSLFASEGGAPWEGRLAIYRICLLSLSTAGWFGFGPGTFAIVFPFLQQKHGGELNGILRYAHQDYLQTTLEWGMLGSLLWMVLIGGGIFRAILHLQRDPRAVAREHGMWIALCALSLIGVLTHSLVDFPLQIASLQLIAAVLLGQLWARSSERDRPPRKRTTFSTRSLAPKDKQPKSTDTIRIMKTQVLALLGILSITGCSTSNIVINAKANRPISTKSNHMVMAAGEMEDLDSADRLATLTEKALHGRGYRSDMNKDADVVVVTQATCITPSGEEITMKPVNTSERFIAATRPAEDAFQSVALLAMRSPDIAGGAGRLENFDLAGEPTEQGAGGSNERLRIMVKAALMKDWMKHETTFAMLPAVWTVTVEGRASPSQRAEFLQQALEAASAYFAQNTKAPQTRAISLDSARHQAPVSITARSEPDLTLDPLQ